MTRTEKLLQGLDLARARGIEVGALDKPIVPPTTVGIFYVDHTDTASLREKYGADPSVDLSNLVEVGGIWGQNTLAEAAASVAPVDFLIASHVIEHVPDLIAWLKEIASVLKPGGDVRLAIPDRRYSFDLLRTETVLADVLAAHFVGARIPQVRQVIDYVANVVDVDCWHIWDGSVDRAALTNSLNAKTIESFARDVLVDKTYIDSHWVFTPLSFANLMKRMAALGYHAFACRQFYETEEKTLEFFVVMEPVADLDEAVNSWSALAARIEHAESARQDEQRNRSGALLEAKIDLLERRVADLTNSNSWKLTAPLRSLKRMLGGASAP